MEDQSVYPFQPNSPGYIFHYDFTKCWEWTSLSYSWASKYSCWSFTIIMKPVRFSIDCLYQWEYSFLFFIYFLSRKVINAWKMNFMHLLRLSSGFAIYYINMFYIDFWMLNQLHSWDKSQLFLVWSFLYIAVFSLLVFCQRIYVYIRYIHFLPFIWYQNSIGPMECIVKSFFCCCWLNWLVKNWC